MVEWDDATYRRVCPFCLQTTDIGELMHIAAHDSLRGDPVLEDDYAPRRFLARQFTDNGQALDAMNQPCSDLACPHCRRKFPAGFVQSPPHIISIVGDQKAGKSYYLCVLVKALSMRLPKLDIAFADYDPTSNTALNDMIIGLFSARTPTEAYLANTQPGGVMYENIKRRDRVEKDQMPRPFVYTLEARAQAAPPIHLVFYDNAGENFHPGISAAQKPGVEHVANAAGILFLFDPFREPGFRHRIRSAGQVQDPQLNQDFRAQQDIILREMRVRIQQLRNLPSGARIQTPLAVVAGKCDAWRHLLGESPFRDPFADGRLCPEALRHNAHQVRALMMDICPNVVAMAEACSENVAFFPASSFGHSPVEFQPGQYAPDPARIQPYQADVPLLWLLSQIQPALMPVVAPETRTRRA